jgi:uncharacterized membrane protein
MKGRNEGNIEHTVVRNVSLRNAGFHSLRIILLNLFVHKNQLCNPAKVRLAACFAMVSYLAYTSAQKVETICSFETSVDFHRTTRRYFS